MKRITLIICLLSCMGAIQAQSDLYNGVTRQLNYKQAVTPFGIEVTYNKTVHILFPAAVKYVDLGSSLLVAGKVEAANNVLRVKSAVENFKGETNFTVVCSDGSFYSFNARYVAEPELLNIDLNSFTPAEGQTKKVTAQQAGVTTEDVADLVLRSIYKSNRHTIRYLGCKRFSISFLIRSIYVHEGMYYLQTTLNNSSNVPFVIDFIRFKITDKKLAKLTATQETIITPIKSYNEQTEVAGGETVRTIYALPRFALPDDKILVVEVYEKDGARHQLIHIENEDFEYAKSISKLKTQ